MPRTLLVLAVLMMIAGMAIPQIQITADSFPEVGSSWTHHDRGTVTVNPGSGGANQTWTIPDHGGWGTYNENFQAPSSTPYAGDFPTATHALTEDGALWGFYRLAGNGVFYQGMAGNAEGTDTLMVLNPEANFIPLPVNYGSTWTTVWHITWDFEVMPDSFVTVTMTDSTLNHADGWGTLNTPFGNWQALRIQEHIYFVVSAPPFFEQTTEEYGYNFMTDNGFQGATMSQNDGDDPDPNFTSGNVNVRTWNPTAADHGRGPVADAFNVGQNYPNPFNPSTMLPVELQRDAMVTLKVYDETGRLVSTKDMALAAGSHSLAIDGSNWATGTYFARIIANEQMKTMKMLLVK